jgi:putative isomerase
MRPMGIVTFAILSFTLLLAQPAKGGEHHPPMAGDVPGMLSHQGIPDGLEDWSFLPFSDQGSWLGFGLPASDSRQAPAFSGPFSFNQGRWLSQRLAVPEIRSPDEQGDWRLLVPVETKPVARPGLLTLTSKYEGLSLKQELWFDRLETDTGKIGGSTIALILFQLENTGASPRQLELTINGSVFDDNTLVPMEGSIRIQTAKGDWIQLITPNGFAPPRIEGRSFELAAPGPLTLAAGGKTSTSLLVRLVIEGSEIPQGSRFSPFLENPEASLQANRTRWSKWLSAVGAGDGVSEPETVVAVKSLQTLVNNWRGPAGRMEHSGIFPSSAVSYFNGYWAWDTWKHAVGTLVFDAELAKDQVRGMFAHQDASGMIADVVYLDAAEDNWRDSKPPLAGWAIEAIYLETGDRDFVREMYPKLIAYHDFWYRDRDHDQDGLCEYGSVDGTLEAARWESGMDNAVRFDNTAMLQNGPGAWSMNQESVDLNSHLYREKRALAVLAQAIGLSDEANRWKEQAEVLKNRIQQQFFDPDSGWFHDIHIDSGAFISAQGPEGWTPLWTGAATREQAARVRDVMLNPEKFLTHVPFPTVSRDNPGFSDGYWRGLVWLAAGHPLLSTSVWPFPLQDLEFVASEEGVDSASGLVPLTSRHGAELQVKDIVTWNIDARQMGVGGDTFWGRPVHDKYSIAAGNQSYRFILIPLDRDDNEPAELVGANSHRFYSPLF